MLTVGDYFPDYSVIGIKPGVPCEDNPSSMFQDLDTNSFKGRWKIFVFYPKDFTFICPTEIASFSDLHKEFEARDTVVLAGSPDNEYSKLAWRTYNKSLSCLRIWQFADLGSCLSNDLGIVSRSAGVPLRATFIVDPDMVIRSVTVYDLSVGRSVNETLRCLDALQSGGLCSCEREIGGDNL